MARRYNSCASAPSEGSTAVFDSSKSGSRTIVFALAFQSSVVTDHTSGSVAAAITVIWVEAKLSPSPFMADLRITDDPWMVAPVNAGCFLGTDGRSGYTYRTPAGLLPDPVV